MFMYLGHSRAGDNVLHVTDGKKPLLKQRIKLYIQAVRCIIFLFAMRITKLNVEFSFYVIFRSHKYQFCDYK